MTEPDNTMPAPETLLGLDEPVSPDALSTPDAETLAWAAHMAPLYAALPERSASDILWPRIARSTRTSPWSWRQPRVWQALAAASVVLSIGLATQLALSGGSAPVSPPEAAAARPILTAGLAGTAAQPGRLAFVMATEADGARIRSSPATAQVMAGQTYHLWLAAPEGRVYVGKLSAEIEHSVPVPDAVRAHIHDGAKLEVSLDAGAEPPVQPDRIVAAGTLVSL